jgi:hypothetical protein
MYFLDAWPTFIPHMATGISIFLVILQFFVNEKSKQTTIKQESRTNR